MSGYRYVDVGIYAPSPWFNLKTSDTRPGNDTSQFLPSRALHHAPIFIPPSQRLKNHNNGGRTPSTYPTRLIAQLPVNNKVLSTVLQHHDHRIDSKSKLESRFRDHNNTPQYSPRSGFVLDPSPRGFYTPFTQPAHHAVSPTVFPRYLDERSHDRSDDAPLYLPSSKAGSHLSPPCEQPSYRKQPAFRKHLLCVHQGPGGGLDAKAAAQRVREFFPPFPPGLGARLKAPLVPRDAHLPVHKFDPFADDEPSDPSPQLCKIIVPAPLASPWGQLLPKPFAPFVPPTKIKSRASNTIDRDRNYGPSVSPFYAFDEASGVDAHKSVTDVQLQVDTNVTNVPVNLVKSSSVPDSRLCDDPVLAALYAPWEQLHLVGLPSESPDHPVSFDSECPVPFSPSVSSPELPGPFMVAKELQSGAFGQAVAVHELRLAMEPRVLCLKVFRKKTVLEHNSLEGIETELRAYRRLEEAKTHLKEFMFLMKLDGALQDDKYIYFAMALMRYDLAAAIQSQHHKEHSARWLAQISLAIGALHTVGIVHRDVKPENVLIDWQNNVRLGDLGLSYVHEKQVSMRFMGPCVYGLVGTPGFWAPEMLDFNGEQAYSNAVDFWSLGCLMYQMLNVNWDLHSLFLDPDNLAQYKLYDRADNDGRGFLEGAGLSDEAEELIYGLLTIEPRQRFGINQIMEARFFDCPDGTNHFRHAYSKARDQPKLENKKIYGNATPSDLPQTLIPKFEQKYPEFPNFEWINPNGAWGRFKKY